MNIHGIHCICSAIEIAVVGPPNLFRVGFKSVGPLAMMKIAWVRSQNNLAQLLPICFAVNTQRYYGCPLSEGQYSIQIHTVNVCSPYIFQMRSFHCSFH